MDLFDVLTLIGGLCLFLFGMNVMGEALESRAGNKLRTLLSKMTTGKFAGFLTGLGVTAIIQSSSATTVMVVGFVNSGLMNLRQAIHVIMGANIGTTVTGWLLSLGGISGDNFWVRLMKPSSFVPVLALVGIILYMFTGSSKKKDTGAIFLGFATLMFGMEAMSGAVSGLSEVPAFRELFIMFTNPILGLLAGTVLTCIIQSSSASVGILQALSMTGQITFGAAIPIVMGDAIGTCITAMLSSIGTKRDAKRAAVAHLTLNMGGALVWLIIYCVIRSVFAPPILTAVATPLGIAIVNTLFKVLNIILFMPLTGLLEKVVCILVPGTAKAEKDTELDERLLATPTLALQQCHTIAVDMARDAVTSLKEALQSFEHYTPQLEESIRNKEDLTDLYEDILGSYLIKLSSQKISSEDGEEVTMLMKIIGDFERISDHAVNVLEASTEMREKELSFSDSAKGDFKVISAAVEEILDLSYEAFANNNINSAVNVEPLEQVIDALKEEMRTRHILRMQQGNCNVIAGFVWSDLLTCLERTSDHCSNIAGCVIDVAHHELHLHETLQAIHEDSKEFQNKFEMYSEKYAVHEL